MTMANYPGGFKDGISIRGFPIALTHPGKVWFVSNATTLNYNQKGGSDSNDGSFNAPFSTLQKAIDSATSNRGDIIFIKPGHAETISTATALAFNKAGVAIIGLGVGALRPTLTLATLTSATIAVSAANITITNVLFRANLAAIASVFTLTTAPEFVVDSCEFRDLSSSLNFITIITTTVAVVADGLVFTNNKIYGLGTTAATTPIKVAGTHNRLTINDNFIVLGVLNNTSAVLAHGALVVTNLEMSRNKVFRLNTDTSGGALLITTSSTTNTGMVSDNYAKTLDVAGMLLVTAGSIYGMSNNQVSGTADSSGILIPAADSDGS